jgi:hypothetical protein
MTPDTTLAPGLFWRAVLTAPVLIAVAAIFRGGHGAASAATGLALAAWNLLMAARSITWAAQRSTTVLAGVALGGYVVRLAVLTVLVLAIKDLSWVDLPVLGFTLVVTHFALVVWEAKAAGFLAPRPLHAGPPVGTKE